MQRYKNLSRESGVVAYELSPGSIVVRFRNGMNYEYTEAMLGAAALAEMQRLARAGRGLSAFISTHVHENYARKFP